MTCDHGGSDNVTCYGYEGQYLTECSYTLISAPQITQHSPAVSVSCSTQFECALKNHNETSSLAYVQVLSILSNQSTVHSFFDHSYVATLVIPLKFYVVFSGKNKEDKNEWVGGGSVGRMGGCFHLISCV